MAEQDAPRPDETEGPEQAARRAEVLEWFLREKPWTRPLLERHQVYLALSQEDLSPEDLAEFTASLITGFPHIGRQGYLGRDKPPFDLRSDDASVLVDAKVFDSGKSQAQNRLKVKRERPRKQFRMWTDAGETAIPCQFAGGRRGWFLVPGIPIKDVPLNVKVTAKLDENNLLKPIRLLDKTDLSVWNDFEELERQWQRALAHLRKHEGAFMVRVRQQKETFGTKEARETLVRDGERRIWVHTAFDLPAAKQEIVEQVSQDREATQQVVERAMDDKESKRRIAEQVSHDREATRQVVERAMSDEVSKQQIVEKVWDDQESKRQIVDQVLHDDTLMRGVLGEELFLQWKARQQKQPPTEPGPDKPPTLSTQE